MWPEAPVDSDFLSELRISEFTQSFLVLVVSMADFGRNSITRFFVANAANIAISRFWDFTQNRGGNSE